MKTKCVGILIFDEVEVLDFCGPFEVFSVTRLEENERLNSPSPFEVILVAEKGDVITTTGGMQVLPQFNFATCPKLDILVVPGGRGTRTEINNPIMLDWLRRQAGETQTLTSVCTGSMLLGFAGLLDGRRATTHWRSLNWMRAALPNVIVDDTAHVVVDGDIFSSAGISAGIDMALQVVTRYCGEQIARDTAKQMEYSYPDHNHRRIQI